MKSTASKGNTVIAYFAFDTIRTSAEDKAAVKAAKAAVKAKRAERQAEFDRQWSAVGNSEDA